MFKRSRHLKAVVGLLERHRVVALVGARQVGKSTLARQIAAQRPHSLFLDLEDPRDLARLADPMLALGDRRGLVVLDEIQRSPELFPALRVLADRAHGPRFLVLGGASAALLKQASESLAGRIVFHDLAGLDLDEVGAARAEALWLRGGFPRSFTARSNRASAEWRRGFVRTFLERDLPQLGVSVPSATMGRFWAMLAHCHGQTLNSSELGRSLGVSDTTIRHYADQLAATFVVRLLPPWHENLSKRQVKAPKIYIADSGLLHTLLDIEDKVDLERHPKLGASWEGFCIAQAVARLGARPEECYFWATHGGAEIDLVVVRGRRRRGFEIKRTSMPSVTPSMRTALVDLKLDSIDVIHAGAETFPLATKIRALALARLLQDLKPL